MSQFECFVTIGSEKRVISLDAGVDSLSVPFGHIYSRLSQSSDVSLESHVFEIFDFSFNAFNRLSSTETPVKYLSRIRVTPKPGVTPMAPQTDTRVTPLANNGTYSSHHKANHKGFESNLNNDYFNPNLVSESRMTEDFFNTDFVANRRRRGGRGKRTPKSPIGAIGDHRPVIELSDSSDCEMNEDFYNENFYSNESIDDYGGDDYPMSGSHAMPTPPPPGPQSTPYYSRRPNPSGPMAGFSFADYSYNTYEDRPYYRRPHPSANPFPNDHYSDYNPNRYMTSPTQQSPMNRYLCDDYSSGATRFETSYGSDVGMRGRPLQNPSFGYPQNPYMNRELSERDDRLSKSMANPYWRAPKPSPQVPRNTQKDVKALNLLLQNGILSQREKGFEYYLCQFCDLKLSPMAEAVDHTSTVRHLHNSVEKYYDPIDRLFLLKLKNKTLQQCIDRRRELQKFDKDCKQRYIRHGIKLKEGTGPTAYVCKRCVCAMPTADDVHKHYKKFLEINCGLNYPKDYHKFDDNALEYNPPKVELRYRRILNALELTVEDNRTEEETEHLIELREEGIVVKESITEENSKHYLCLICDKRFDAKEEALTHGLSEEHLKQRSSDHYNGLDKAFLTDSDCSGQLEVVLARKQELEKMNFTIKEKNLEHGIRMKNAIGPEAYVCLTCDEKFETLMDARLHIDEYEKRLESSRIQESSEESLLDSAKRQMELLERERSETEVDLTHDEMIDNLVDGIVVETESELRFEEEGIKVVETPTDTDLNDPKAAADREVKYFDMFCNIHINGKRQAVQHLSRAIHKRMKSGDFLKDVDKAFLIETNRLDEFVVANARIQVLNRLTDEVKAKSSEEGIRLKDGTGKEAFWCITCNAGIESQSVESSQYSFTNHINYNQQHIENTISQNK